MKSKIEPIPISQWSRDHWSLLGYVAAMFDGELNRERMRCNHDKHPFMAHRGGWDDACSTRLREGFVIGHDDWDCMEDLESEGLVAIQSMINCRVRLTEKGNQLAFRLREHKANGGTFSTFNPISVEDDE
jgi:hypothetical protein